MKLNGYIEGAFVARADHACSGAPALRVRIVPPTNGRVEGTGLSAAWMSQFDADVTVPVPASGGPV